MNTQKLQDLQQSMARDIPQLVACGLISMEDGLPVAGYSPDPNLDLEVPAGMFTQAFQATERAFEYSNWGRVDELILSGPDYFIILFRVGQAFYQGIACRTGVQLGLVRAVFKRYVQQVEAALEEN